MQHTQPRTCAEAFAGHVTAIVFELCEAIMPVIRAVARDFRIPASKHDRAVARLRRVFHQLIALTTRMNPARLGQAFFAPLRPQTNPATPATPPQPRHPTHAPTPPRHLSARRTAMHLEALLQELESVAREIGYTLPQALQALCEEARAELGCHALTAEPPQQPTATPPHPPTPQPRPKSVTPTPWATLEL